MKVPFMGGKKKENKIWKDARRNKWEQKIGSGLKESKQVLFYSALLKVLFISYWRAPWTVSVCARAHVCMQSHTSALRLGYRRSLFLRSYLIGQGCALFGGSVWRAVFNNPIQLQQCSNMSVQLCFCGCVALVAVFINMPLDHERASLLLLSFWIYYYVALHWI